MTGDDSTPERRSAARERADPEQSSTAAPRGWHGADDASRAVAYILAGPAVWGGIGWLADRWLGTDPWLLSAGIVIGFAGGLYLLWLRTKPQAGRGLTTRDDQDDPEG